MQKTGWSTTQLSPRKLSLAADPWGRQNFDGILCVQHKFLCGPAGHLTEWYLNRNAGYLTGNATAQLQRDCRVWELGMPTWDSAADAWDYSDGAQRAILAGHDLLLVQLGRQDGRYARHRGRVERDHLI